MNFGNYLYDPWSKEPKPLEYLENATEEDNQALKNGNMSENFARHICELIRDKIYAETKKYIVPVCLRDRPLELRHWNLGNPNPKGDIFHGAGTLREALVSRKWRLASKEEEQAAMEMWQKQRDAQDKSILMAQQVAAAEVITQSIANQIEIQKQIKTKEKTK